jgi:hypothetical protein
MCSLLALVVVTPQWAVSATRVDQPATRLRVGSLRTRKATPRGSTAEQRDTPRAERVPSAPTVSGEGAVATTFLDLDFEDGQRPSVLDPSSGHVSGAVPSRSGNRHGLAGSLSLGTPGRKPGQESQYEVVLAGRVARGEPQGSLFPISSAVSISFDYWVGAGTDRLLVEVVSNANVSNVLHVSSLVRQTWAHVELPLDGFNRYVAVRGDWVREPMAVREGGRATALVLRAIPVASDGFFVDNIRVFARRSGRAD